MATLKVEIDCTRVTCGACLLRPNADSAAPQCPMWMSPESKLVREAGGGFMRCDGCRRAEIEAGSIVMGSWMPSFACAIACVVFMLIAFKADIWWFAMTALIYLVWAIQFMPQRKRSSTP